MDFLYQELLRRAKKSQNQNPVRNQGLGPSCLWQCLIVMLVLCILGHICSFFIDNWSFVMWVNHSLAAFKASTFQVPTLIWTLTSDFIGKFSFFQTRFTFPHFTHWETYLKKNLWSNNFLEDLCDLSCCNDKGCSFYLYSKEIKVLKTK